MIKNLTLKNCILSGFIFLHISSVFPLGINTANNLQYETENTVQISTTTVRKVATRCVPLRSWYDNFLNSDFKKVQTTDEKENVILNVQERLASTPLEHSSHDTTPVELRGGIVQDDKKEGHLTSELDMKSNFQKVTYIGAVLEYEPYNTWTDEEGFGVLRENANRIVLYAGKAKNKSVDILISPEYGLQSLNMYHNTTEEFLTFTQYIPDPSAKVILCKESSDSQHLEAMKILSCGAQENHIYLVVDLAELCPCSNNQSFDVPWEIELSADCPEIGYFVFNTQAVFNREGAVIARYRKQNLYLEENFTPGPHDDVSALFITDFDVAFSLQICFDIMFEHPGYSNVQNYGIRDVAMSTAWVDELPFDLADSNQNGWSRGLGTNLLVSGYHDPENYNLGSGIFRSFAGDEPVYTFDKNSGNVLLVAPVTTISASSLGLNKTEDFTNTLKRNQEESPLSHDHLTVNFSTNEEDRKHSILHQNLSEYTRIVLNKTQTGEVQNITACTDHNLCCDLSYEYSGNLTYQFMVYSGVNYVGDDNYFIGIQQCAIVWCKNSLWETCARVEFKDPDDYFGPFKISSSSFKADLVFPLGNTRNFSLIGVSELKYTREDDSFITETESETENLLIAGIYGRWFELDSHNRSKRKQ